MKPILSLTALLLVATACSPGEDERQADGAVSPDSSRQADVATLGAEVMAFDLDRSTHFFESDERGGLQTVVSDDGDTTQVGAIRAHLKEEAERFALGDFHDPAMIHGDDMAGLHALVAGADRITIEYRDVELGGEIRYTSEDDALVVAIHDWFAAQLRDHGEHAQGSR
jgi:hypothetical protein